MRQGGQRPAGLRWPWRPPCWAPAKRGGGPPLVVEVQTSRFLPRPPFLLPAVPQPGGKGLLGAPLSLNWGGRRRCARAGAGGG